MLTYLLVAVASGIGVLAAAGGKTTFLMFTVVVVAFAAWQFAVVLNRLEARVPTITASVSAVAFPLLTGRWEEAVTLRVGAIVVLGTAVFLLLGGFRPQMLHSLSGTVFVSAICGMLGTYLILLRELPDGTSVVVALVFLLAAYLAGRLVAERLIDKVWSGTVGGLVGALLGGLGSLLFLDEPFSIGPVIAIAVVVGLASTVGFLTGKSLFARVEPQSNGILLAVIGATAVGAPAFFYSFRLYLT